MFPRDFTGNENHPTVQYYSINHIIIITINNYNLLPLLLLLLLLLLSPSSSYMVNLKPQLHF